jgi:NADH-quinone oxidoreductase subunit N
MSSPILWLFIPILISGISLFFTRQRVLLKWAGTGINFLLALSALVLPVNQDFRLLFWTLNISDELLVFGRRFILSPGDQPVVALVFALGFIWFLLLDPDLVPIHTIPLGMAGNGLILTAYAVDPLFYGALFFAFLALIDVVLLSPPGSQPTPGALRFLVFQILGMLFILFASWLASWLDLNAGDQLLLARSLLILALGFSFLLAIFPFLSWVPMVAEENHPFLGGYVFYTYFLGAFLYGMRFISEGGWLSRSGNLQGPLQLAGLLMLGIGGVMAFFNSHLGRLTSALVIANIGRSLLAISLFMSGFPILYALIVIQALGLGLWSLALTNLVDAAGDLDYANAAGSAWQWPLTTAGLLVGYFSLAGLPLLAGFPVSWALGTGLSYYPLWIPVAYGVGWSGLIIGGLRLVNALARRSGEEQVLILGHPIYRYLILALILLLLLLGLFPGILGGISNTIAASLTEL